MHDHSRSASAVSARSPRFAPSGDTRDGTYACDKEHCEGNESHTNPDGRYFLRNVHSIEDIKGGFNVVEFVLTRLLVIPRCGS